MTHNDYMYCKHTLLTLRIHWCTTSDFSEGAHPNYFGKINVIMTHDVNKRVHYLEFELGVESLRRVKL